MLILSARLCHLSPRFRRRIRTRPKRQCSQLLTMNWGTFYLLIRMQMVQGHRGTLGRVPYPTIVAPCQGKAVLGSIFLRPQEVAVGNRVYSIRGDGSASVLGMVTSI